MGEEPEREEVERCSEEVEEEFLRVGMPCEEECKVETVAMEGERRLWFR